MSNIPAAMLIVTILCTLLTCTNNVPPSWRYSKISNFSIFAITAMWTSETFLGTGNISLRLRQNQARLSAFLSSTCPLLLAFAPSPPSLVYQTNSSPSTDRFSEKIWAKIKISSLYNMYSFRAAHFSCSQLLWQASHLLYTTDFNAVHKQFTRLLTLVPPQLHPSTPQCMNSSFRRHNPNYLG